MPVVFSASARNDLKVTITSGSEMYTFIELQGFSKRRQELLPDDEFRAFQEVLIEDPEAGC